MSVAAVVVYYATPQQIGATLAALSAQCERPGQTLVVDNSVADHGEPPFNHDTLDGSWELSESNDGFGAACNRGAALTDSEYILFMNADVQLGRRTVRVLRDRLVADPGAAVVGPRMVGQDGRIELSARHFPTVRTGFMGRMSLATAVLRRLGWTPPALATANRHDAAVVDWVSGACMLVRRTAFESVGGFDPGYWMYWEDADLCRRLGNDGWRIWFEPDGLGRHATGSSGRTERTIVAFHASAARYYALHVARGPRTARIARRLLMLRARILARRLRHQLIP